ncbi:MAG: hypothetical protein EXR87_06020 [Gammaproteobacteria bacterium]|nr:hypothetical protein [Gammaproteobacteria bacterium]
MGKVPYFEPSEDWHVPESTSIIEYLEDKFPSSNSSFRNWGSVPRTMTGHQGPASTSISAMGTTTNGSQNSQMRR